MSLQPAVGQTELERMIRELRRDVGHLQRVSSEQGIWVPYTPTLTSGSLGTGGTATGKYTTIGKTAHFQSKIVFGTSPVITSNTIISTPTLASNLHPNAAHVKAVLVDAGNNSIDAQAILWSTGISVFIHLVVAGVAGWAGGVTATSPFTWAANDEIHLSGTYPIA